MIGHYMTKGSASLASGCDALFGFTIFSHPLTVCFRRFPTPYSLSEEYIVLKFPSGIFDHEILGLEEIQLPTIQRREDLIFDLRKIQEMRKAWCHEPFPARPY